MNERQKEIYANLLRLTETTDAFYFVDQIRDGVIYRIFTYRITNYEDFYLPDARVCRGTMFEIDFDTKQPKRLVSLPFNKFFNVGETPLTLNPDWDQMVSFITDKVDGSLISTYAHHGKVALKSKAALFSQQAVEAEYWLYKEENSLFLNEIWKVMQGHNDFEEDCTVIMEWTAPNNRIVLSYDKPALTILGVRSNVSGLYVPREFFRTYGANEIYSRWVNEVSVDNVNAFVQTVSKMENIEGFVFTMFDGEMLKLKTEWYLQRHRLKDGIQHPRHLFEAIVNENVDDAKTLFKDDVQTMTVITDMENLVIPKFNKMIATVEKFYGDNRLLNRKDYAILAQSKDDGYMGLKMNLYLQRSNDYKAFAIKNYKDFIGEVADTTVED